MCGRYLVLTDDDYEDIKNIVNEVSEKFKKPNVVNGEVYPTNNVPVVYSYNGRNILSAAKWGFPNFKNSGVIINARAESLAEKPMFRNAFMTQRCLVPANGYYEWLQQEDKKKTKYLLCVKEKQLFYMAGLYNLFTDKSGNKYSAITIVTTEANSDVSFIHNRMPAIIQDEAIKTWLNINIKELDQIQQLLIPYEVGRIVYDVINQE